MGGVDQEAAYDELFEPLALALGHLVFGAAVLEKAMLADLIHRRVIRDGGEAVFGQDVISRLERKPAGALLPELRQMGYDDDLAGEIAAVIGERNHFIHHLFEDAEFIRSVTHREGVARIVLRVETVVERIDHVVKKLEPGVVSGMQEMFGRSPPELLDLIKEIDPNEFEDGEERRQLEALQGFPDDFLDEGGGLGRPS